MERIIFEVEFDQNNAQKNVNDLEKSIMNLKKSQDELKKSYQNGLLSQEDYINQNSKLNNELKTLKNTQSSYQRELDLITKATNANSMSYQELTYATALAEKQLKEMQGTLKINADGTIELSDEYEKQSEKVRQLRETLVSFDQQIKNGKTNVGNYSSAFDGLRNSFGGVFGGLEQGIDVVNNIKLSFIQLFTTLIANPFFALAAALTAIVGYFISTEKGAKKLEVVMAGLNQIFTPLLSAVAKLGEFLFGILEVAVDLVSVFVSMKSSLFGIINSIPGISQLFDFLTGIGTKFFEMINTIKSFTSAIAGAFNSSYKEAQALTEQMQKVEANAKKIEVISAKNLAQQEKLKNFRDDELNSYEERAKANQEALSLEINRGKMIQEQKEKELSLLKKKLEMTPQNLRTSEMQVKIYEKEKELADEITDSLGKQNEYITTGNSILRDRLTLQADIKTAQLETEINENKIKKGSIDELNARKKLAKERLVIELKQYETGKHLAKLGADYFSLTEDEKIKRVVATHEGAKLSFANYLKDSSQLQRDFNEEQKEKAKENSEKLARANTSFLETLVMQQKLSTQNSIKIEQDLIRAKLKEQLLNTDLTQQERVKLTKEAELQISKIKTDFENKNAIALLNIQKNATLEGTKERLDIEIKYLQEQQRQSLQDVTLTAEQRKQIESDTQKAISDLQDAYALRNRERQIKQNELTTQLSNAKLNAENSLLQKNAELVLADLEMKKSKQGFLLKEDLDLKEQFLEEQTNLEKQKIQSDLENQRIAIEKRLENERFEIEQRLGLGAEYEAEFLLLKKNADLELYNLEIQSVQNMIDLDNKRTKNAIAMSEERKASFLSELDLTRSVLGQSKELFKQNTIAYKVIASAEASISTYLAASKALASAPPPFSFILAGLTTASGLLNVAKINEIEFGKGGTLEFNKLAKGGIFGGKPHSNGGTKGYFDDGTQIEVERGEMFAVVNKKNTSMLQTLSYLNSYGGNGNPYFENGGLMGIGKDIIRNNETFTNTLQVMQAYRPILQITELNRVQSNIDVVQKIASS
jgi:uncharacterized protein YqgQ